MRSSLLSFSLSSLPQHQDQVDADLQFVQIAKERAERMRSEAIQASFSALWAVAMRLVRVWRA